MTNPPMSLPESITNKEIKSSYENMVVAAAQIRIYLNDFFNRYQISYDFLDKFEALANRANDGNANPLNDAEKEHLDSLMPKIQKLYQVAADYHSKQKKIGDNGHPQRNASILSLPSKDGKSIISHINYPLYTHRSRSNPLGYTSLEIKAASKEAAKKLRFTCESNFWGSKIKIRDANGNHLSKEQIIAYYEVLSKELEARGLPAYVHRMPLETKEISISEEDSKKVAIGEEKTSQTNLSSDNDSEHSPDKTKAERKNTYQIKDGKLIALDGERKDEAVDFDPSKAQIPYMHPDSDQTFGSNWRYNYDNNILTLTHFHDKDVPARALAAALNKKDISKEDLEILVNGKELTASSASNNPIVPSAEDPAQETQEHNPE